MNTGEQIMRRRSSVDGVDAAQVGQERQQTGLEEEEESHQRHLYSTRRRRYSLEREQEQCRWQRCEGVYNHTLSSQMVEWIPIHSTHHIN